MGNSAVNQPTHERISQIEMEKRLKEAGKQEQFYSIALFDILGFSNYVTTHGNQTILELYNKLLDIVYTPDISKAVPIRMSDDWKEGQYIANANGHVNVCHFSDTFIIYVHYLCRREAYWLATPKYEPYPLLLGEKDTPYCPIFYQEHQIYLSFLQTCMDFFCQSIIAGIPLRGCVSSGFALMDSNQSIYFGTPLVEAARGEPARKAIGISFGKSFNNHHPVYNDYFIPFLDWPRYWRISPDFKDFSFANCIKKMIKVVTVLFKAACVENARAGRTFRPVRLSEIIYSRPHKVPRHIIMGHRIAQQLLTLHGRTVIRASPPALFFRHFHRIFSANASRAAIFRSRHTPFGISPPVFIVKGLRAVPPSSDVIIADHVQFPQKFHLCRTGFRTDLVVCLRHGTLRVEFPADLF